MLLAALCCSCAQIWTGVAGHLPFDELTLDATSSVKPAFGEGFHSNAFSEVPIVVNSTAFWSSNADHNANYAFSLSTWIWRNDSQYESLILRSQDCGNSCSNVQRAYSNIRLQIVGLEIQLQVPMFDMALSYTSSAQYKAIVPIQNNRWQHIVVSCANGMNLSCSIYANGMILQTIIDLNSICSDWI